MFHPRVPLLIALATSLGCSSVAAFAVEEPLVGIVSHVKVVSDKVENVSSLEAWKKSFIKDGMTDEEKALAVWKSVVAFQYQDAPPDEYLQSGGNVLDPIKGMNVYGYSLCSVASAHVQCLARYAGLQARGWTINSHVVPEIEYAGAWRLLDSSLITYFPKPDGKPAGVEEIVAGVKEWREKHPEIVGDEKKLREFMRGGGWKKGPEILSRCAFYDENGWLPAATHGWYATMDEYSGKTLFPYEAGYSQGYAVNVQLRQGERLTREWGNRGLHINMDHGAAPDALKGKVGEGGLRYSPKFGDLAPGRIGNGLLEYEPLLANGLVFSGALTVQNLTCMTEDRRGPALHLRNPSQPGTLVIRMPSSYVYLGGELQLVSAVGEGGSVDVQLSENNGLDWKPVTMITTSGELKIDLKPFIYRRYDYRLKFTLSGNGTGLEKLRIAHPIQHSQRPLPALDAGANTLTFSSDGEGTITIEGAMDAENKGKQLHYTDFHPLLKNIGDKLTTVTGGTGEITFPVETPGELTRLRIGAHYRARDARDVWEVQVSYDGGQTFATVDRMQGPFVGMGRYILVKEIPPGTRSVQVRFLGAQRNTLMFNNLRIDADYREPRGGFRPVKITYAWEENGQPKQHVHVAKQPGEIYTINCAARPVMKSLVMELAE